ncbi:MAG: hypothetical protein ACHQF0_02025 [Chitinophagales bacterium]
MLPFIEITTKDDKKLLINTNIIEMIQVTRGKTYLKYKADNASGAPGLEIKDDYEAIKRQLSKQK